RTRPVAPRRHTTRRVTPVRTPARTRTPVFALFIHQISTPTTPPIGASPAMTTNPSTARPFADSVAAYALAGWPCVLPVPADKKWPPPVGFTGTDGRDTDPMQLVVWAGSHAAHAIALRMPDNVIGIDVDHYDKTVTTDAGTHTVQKRGADTLATYEARWGRLPRTWSSTARGSDQGPGPSRIMFFRVPPGRYTTKLGDAIEIIQRHHRYAVVAPSP